MDENEYKIKAYKILNNMALYIMHVNDEQKNEYCKSKLKEIENFIDCTNLVENFKEIVKK